MKMFVSILCVLLYLPHGLVQSNSNREPFGKYLLDVYRKGHMSEERGRRAVTLADLGAAAIKVMVRGASEGPKQNNYALMYTKAGSLKAAIRDFREIGTVNNRKVITKDGGVYYEGVVGDKTVRLRIKDKRHQGQPTILAFDPTKQRQYKSQVQVVYVEQAPRTSGWH